MGAKIQTSPTAAAFLGPPTFYFPSQGANEEVQKDMASPLLSDLGAETHQFHTGLLVVQYQTLQSSNAESVFRFSHRHRPAESIAGHAVLLLYAPFPGHHGKCSRFSMNHGNCGHLSFPSLSSPTPPSASSNSSPPPIHPPSAPQHDIMSRCWVWDPWYSGMCSPHGSETLTPPPCGKADGRGTCREL